MIGDKQMPSATKIVKKFSKALARNPSGLVICIDRSLFESAFSDLEKLLQKEKKSCQTPPKS